MKSFPLSNSTPLTSVTSYAEVWIEMYVTNELQGSAEVTSYAEVWIEIGLSRYPVSCQIRHLLRGGVD